VGARAVLRKELSQHHSESLTDTGKVYVFGTSTSGQLGTGEMKAQIDMPQILGWSLESVKVVLISTYRVV